MKGKRFALELLEIAKKNTDLPLVLGSAKGYAFYTIYCPVFSDVQRASTLDGASDYRTGISIQPYKKGFEIGITSIFSKTLLKNFISNTSQNDLDKLIKEISGLSSECLFATWASKQLLKSAALKSKVKRTSEEFRFFYYGINEPIEDFYTDLRQEKIDFKNWSKDIGCNPPSSGLGLVEGGRGAFLSLGGYFLKDEKNSMQEMIKLLIPYLANFLPTDVKKGRNSNLRRTLKGYYERHDLQFECAYNGCRKKTNLDAAHIKPHKNGGSDFSANGLWLCPDHHLAQEGKGLEWHRKNIKNKFLKHTTVK